MKKTFITLMVVLSSLIWSEGAFCESIDELIDEFAKEYEALKPSSPASSVSSDYKLGQSALAAFYTIKTLSLMYRQNQEILSKYNEMLQKYDEIIKQNKEIIRILSILSEKGKKE